MTIQCDHCGKQAGNEGEAKRHGWGWQYLTGGIIRWFCPKCMRR